MIGQITHCRFCDCVRLRILIWGWMWVELDPCCSLLLHFRTLLLVRERAKRPVLLLFLATTYNCPLHTPNSYIVSILYFPLDLTPINTYTHTESFFFFRVVEDLTHLNYSTVRSYVWAKINCCQGKHTQQWITHKKFREEKIKLYDEV